MANRDTRSEADIAYQILRQEGSPIHFRDLINQVLAEKDGPISSRGHAMAEVHTQINIDSRFFHMGKGNWGLVEWVPQRGGTGRAVEETSDKSFHSNLRREKLLEEIQQDFVKAAPEPEEIDDNS